MTGGLALGGRIGLDSPQHSELGRGLTSAGFVRGAVLVALVSGLGASVHASAPQPARSFRLVERLDGPRVISWQAKSQGPGGHFVLWRIGDDAREVARLDALPGTHQYRFVDEHGSAGAGFVVYRLAYEAGDGSGRLLLVAMLARSNLRAGAVVPSPNLAPEAQWSLPAGVAPPAQAAEVTLTSDAHEFFEFSGPEPPPPRG